MTHKLTPRKQQLGLFYEAFNGNLDALDRIVSPDWVSHEPNPGQGKGGRERPIPRAREASGWLSLPLARSMSLDTMGHAHCLLTR